LKFNFRDKFFSRTILYTFGEFLVKGSKFLLIPFYTRVFTVEEFGILQQILLVAAPLGFLIDFSTKESLLKLYFDYKKKNQEKSLVGSLFITILGIGFLVSLFAIISIFLGITSFNNIDYSVFVLFIIGYLIFLALTNLGLTVMRVQNKVGIYALYAFFLTLFELLVIIYFVKFLSLGILGKFQASFLVAFIFFLLIYIVILRRNINFTLNIDHIKNFFKFSTPLTITNFMGWFIVSIDLFLINVYFGVRELALYSLGVQILQIYKTIAFGILKSFNVVLFENFELLKNSLNKIIFGYFSLFSLIVCFFIFFSKAIIFLIATPNFIEAHTVIILLALSRMLSSISLIFQYIIQKFEENKRILLSFTISSISLVFLSLFLIPEYKINGAAASTTISQIILYFLLFFNATTLVKLEIDKKIIVPLLMIASAVLFNIGYFNFVSFTIFLLNLLFLLYLNIKNFGLYAKIFKNIN